MNKGDKAVENLRRTFAQLRWPVDPHDISWRVAGKTDKGKPPVVVPYIQAHLLRDRLDAVFGPWHWMETLKIEDVQIVGGKSVLAVATCRIALWAEGEWVMATAAADHCKPVGDDTAAKGAETLAFRRAAASWDICGSRQMLAFPRPLRAVGVPKGGRYWTRDFGAWDPPEVQVHGGGYVVGGVECRGAAAPAEALYSFLDSADAFNAEMRRLVAADALPARKRALLQAAGDRGFEFDQKASAFVARDQ